MIAQSQATTLGKKPTHRLYLITGTEGRPIWTAIGAAWPNRDGLGFNLNCTAIPTNGRIVMRKIKPREDENQGRLM